MPKSTFTQEYAVFIRRLREVREAAGLTQEQLAQRLGQGQSFVSKYERGERRLDVVELSAVCQAIGISSVEFIQSLETRDIPQP